MAPSVNDFYVQALMLSEIVKRILDVKASIHLSKVSSLELRPIVDFMHKMRVSSLEKFEQTTFISLLHFYKNPRDMELQDPIGLIILYIPEDYIDELLKKLDYPMDDDDDEEALEAACGTICNLIGGNFKSGLTQLGYQELEMSHFSSYQNQIFDGVAYCKSRPEKYEISYEIKGEKKMVIDFNMGKIPKIAH
jgi:hypothetical protein